MTKHEAPPIGTLSQAEINAAFESNVTNHPSDPEEKKFEVATVRPPDQAVSYEEWHDVIAARFPSLVIAAEAGMSLLAQLLIRDITNCGAIVLIDAPSSGKTIALNFFDGLEGLTYSTDTFTPASFVSNSANIKKENLKQVDLLPRIRRTMLLIRDMATILSARDDDLLKNLGILTRVLDGEGLSTDTGVHGQRSLRGDYVFELLAASTPFPPRVWKTMGTLGPRLLFLSLHTPTKSEDVLMSQLKGAAYKTKELECRAATRDLACGLWQRFPEGVEWQRDKDDEALLRIIVRCASLLSRLRGQVVVHKEWTDDKKIELVHTSPNVEKPDRLNQVLYNIARGHALSAGRTNLAREDMPLILRLTFDSAPGNRAPVFRKLIEHQGLINAAEIEAHLNCSNPTALKEMETLCILGICTEEDNYGPAKHFRLRPDLDWFLSEECQTFLHPDKEKTPLSKSDPV